MACDACGPGAKIAIHAQNLTLALALGENGAWGADGNSSSRYARRRALSACANAGGANPRIVLLIHPQNGVQEEVPQPPLPRASEVDRRPTAYERQLEATGWGAISLSVKTRSYSFAVRQPSAVLAEYEAIRQLGQRSGTADAVAFSGCSTFLALAQFEDRFGFGRDEDENRAEAQALQNLIGWGSASHVVLVIDTRTGIRKHA